MLLSPAVGPINCGATPQVEAEVYLHIVWALLCWAPFDGTRCCSRRHEGVYKRPLCVIAFRQWLSAGFMPCERKQHYQQFKLSTVLVAHPYCEATDICVRATVLTYVDSVFAGSTDITWRWAAWWWWWWTRLAVSVVQGCRLGVWFKGYALGWAVVQQCVIMPFRCVPTLLAALRTA